MGTPREVIAAHTLATNLDMFQRIDGLIMQYEGRRYGALRELERPGGALPALERPYDVGLQRSVEIRWHLDATGQKSKATLLGARRG